VVKKQEHIMSMVINTLALTKATATTGTDTFQHVFQERRQILGFQIRVGQAFTGPLLDGAVVEMIAELSNQALGLTEGVMGTLALEVMAKALIAAPTDGVALWEDRVKTQTVMAPPGFAWVFEKGEGIYLHQWWNNGSGGDQVVHSYVILYYVE